MTESGRRKYLYPIFFVFFLGIWILPNLWAGLIHTKIPYAGLYLNNLYRTACLFTYKVNAWNEFYITLSYHENADFTEAIESDFFQMEPFGHRTRLHRMLNKSIDQPHGMYQRQKLATFIKERQEQLHPEMGKVFAVRFYQVPFYTSESLAKEEGHWKKKPFSILPISSKRILSTHFFDNFHLPTDRNGKEVLIFPRTQP